MPTVPTNSKCSHLGCNTLRSRYSSFCLQHGGRDTQLTYRSEERDKAHSFYLTAQWQRHRARQLSRQPLCEACFSRGIITGATEVDHLFPWRQIGPKAFYHNLFQSLCHDCHSHKTQQEKKGKVLWYGGGEPMTYQVNDYHLLMIDQKA
jgi:5-methylcytosine-specific restriction protein A